MFAALKPAFDVIREFNLDADHALCLLWNRVRSHTPPDASECSRILESIMNQIKGELGAVVVRHRRRTEMIEDTMEVRLNAMEQSVQQMREPLNQVRATLAHTDIHGVVTCDSL